MARLSDIVITESSLTALQFIESYRYLSVAQVARIAGLKPKSASEMLLKLERQNLLGSFGNTGVRGYGKTPKMYYLTKSGHGLLAAELSHRGSEIGAYRQISINSRWSPMMYHRLATLDVMIALEVACRELASYALAKTLVEYRREKIGGRWRRETTDYVSDRALPEDRIVPDAGFVLENSDTGARALFLLEVDCGTERLTTRVSDAAPQSFAHKIDQYDRYLLSRRAATRYSAFGEFPYFTLLIITSSEARMQNMRQALRSDNPDVHRFYRLSTMEAVMQNFFHDAWWGRDPAEPSPHRIIAG